MMASFQDKQADKFDAYYIAIDIPNLVTPKKPFENY